FLELRTARAWASRLADTTAAPPGDLRALLEALAAGRVSPDEALAQGSTASPGRPDDPPTGDR
ncbi:MAG TPA: hypothetical protein VLS89_09910, partial [Candidatus Nanopelagicales bacterium]|nr:hypothetical protein [Candidatus Nanopelagicales bacterium]